MKTLCVDLPDGCSPHPLLCAIAAAIDAGKTSGTVAGCTWEIKQERGEDLEGVAYYEDEADAIEAAGNDFATVLIRGDRFAVPLDVTTLERMTDDGWKYLVANVQE